MKSTSSKSVPNPVLVRLTHGNGVECMYRGAAVIMGPPNEVVWQLGDVEASTCIRSALKPLQAIAVIVSGAFDAFGLGNRELALASASHDGETDHVDVVRTWLDRIDVCENDLACCPTAPQSSLPGTRTTGSRGASSKVHNGCSGKHAGYLTLARHMNVNIDGYCDPEHPVQQAVFHSIGRMMGLDVSSSAMNTDYCEAPNLHAPLVSFAIAFSRMIHSPAASPEGQAADRLLCAMAKYPHLIGGSGRFCTVLTEIGQGNLIGKMGAEGAFVTFIRDRRLILLVKIDDGFGTAAEIATCQILRKLGAIDDHQYSLLENFANPRLLSGSGNRIGEYSGVEFRIP